MPGARRCAVLVCLHQAFPSQGKVPTRLLDPLALPLRRSCSPLPAALLPGDQSIQPAIPLPPKVYLIIRSDDGRMNHSTTSGLEHLLGIDLSLSRSNTPSAPRFLAVAAVCPTWKYDKTISKTTEGSVILAGHLQLRSNLVVTHVGIDEEELGALNGRHGADALPGTRAARRERSSSRVSCGSAGPSLPAAFSSSRTHS